MKFKPINILILIFPFLSISQHSKLNEPNNLVDNISFTDLISKGGSPFSLTEQAKGMFRFTKNLGEPNNPVMGVYVRFTYNDIKELNRTFALELTKNKGNSNLNQLKILKGVTDWNPRHFPIHLNYHEGVNKINLYQHIMASSQNNIDYYSAATELWLLIAYFNGFDLSKSKNKVFDYDMKMYMPKGNVINDDLGSLKPYITCWGDSLTAGGGWTSLLGTLSGMTVYNAGTGGENARTILARQGGDVMLINNITIPASTTPVLIADRDVDGGINTALGHKVTPLLQGGAHVNPCFIGDVQGTLQWTGSGHSDLTGDWVFTRAEAGSEVIINRPTAIRTYFDINKNKPHLQVIFIGQNGGYNNIDELIKQHKYLIEHSQAEHTVILGLSSGTAALRADYEKAMRKEFGRLFVSLREYLAAPTYGTGGNTIVSCYGLDDAGLKPTQADLDAIALGMVPPQLLSDNVHFTDATKKVIGNMIYKKCKDLNIFQ